MVRIRVQCTVVLKLRTSLIPSRIAHNLRYNIISLHSQHKSSQYSNWILMVYQKPDSNCSAMISIR